MRHLESFCPDHQGQAKPCHLFWSGKNGCQRVTRSVFSPINTPKMLGHLYPDSLATRLYPSDLLVLFERQNCEKTSFYKNLKKSGLNIKVVNDENIHLLSEDNDDVVWAADGRTFRGLKRKVVIFVEGTFRPSNIPIAWTRLCVATSCTAQLIWVRG